MFAQVVATPREIRLEPGNGDRQRSCASLGTPFNPALAADGQNSDCFVTYPRSSAGLANQAYKVTASVIWYASWTGSGGTGGQLPPVTVTTSVSVRVAEGQALVTVPTPGK
ncbi:hypothetical protein OHA25_08205 [Nonomuraea sp. NBC_00507]|uniref:hypothetical protein n=1 Tax=Nonomuraea sp. NBC_00507 TaxID=2976002 RepID=UPI002E1821D2